MVQAKARRLSRLEAQVAPSVTVCCVQIGDGPALRADGQVCTVHHVRVIVLGGDGSASKDG